MNTKPPRILLQEEIRNLIMACSNHLKPIVLMALMTGMRKKEIIDLEWDQVDFEHGRIHVFSMKSDRTIPMTKTVRHLLQGLTREQDIPYVFHDPETGKPFRDIRHPFLLACEKANITGLHFYNLRHNFINFLFMANVSYPDVLEIMGYRRPYAWKRCCNLSIDYKANVLAQVDKLLKE